MDIKNYFSKTVHPRLLYTVTDVCEFSDLNRKQVGFILTILVRLRMVYREIKKRGASNRYLYRAR